MDFNLDLSFSNQQNDTRPSLTEDNLYDMLIVGGGPAGLNAALYAKRKGLTVGIITKNLGGQVINTSVVENYLGRSSLSGESLVDTFVNHINELDIPVKEYVEVDAIKTHDGIHTVNLTTGEQFRSKTIILTTGSKPRHLNIPGEKDYIGKGVAYCAICDAPLFRGKDVIVAGGGNSAVEAALDLSKIAKSVTMVHRSQLRADQVLVDKLMNDRNIDIHLETQILEVNGNQTVTHITVKDKSTDEIKTINTDGVFVEIGYVPNNQPFKNLVATTDRGEVIVDHINQTNIAGIYAAGDVTNTPYKQIIIAASEGAKAALAANDYLNQLNQ